MVRIYAYVGGFSPPYQPGRGLPFVPVVVVATGIEPTEELSAHTLSRSGFRGSEEVVNLICPAHDGSSAVSGLRQTGPNETRTETKPKINSQWANRVPERLRLAETRAGPSVSSWTAVMNHTTS